MKNIFVLVLLVATLAGCATSRQLEVEAMTPNAAATRPEVAVAVRVTTRFR